MGLPHPSGLLSTIIPALSILMQQMHEEVKTIVTSYVYSRTEKKQNIILHL